MRKMGQKQGAISTADARARLARANKRSQERKAKAAARGGSNDNRTWAEPMELAGRTFFVPDTIPGKDKEGNTVLNGDSFYLKDEGTSMPSILMPDAALQYVYTHSVQNFEDLRVLPRNLSRPGSTAYKWAKYLCTHDDDVLDVDMSEYQPSSAWDGDVLCEDEYYITGITRSRDGWKLDLPDTFQFKRDWEDLLFESKMEAQAHAEAALASARSCVFCAQSAHDFANGVRDSAVWGRRELALIPLFSLQWMIGEEGNRGDRWFFKTDYKNPDVEPAEDDVAIRRGWGWLETSLDKSSRSSFWKTFEEYQRYICELGSTCSNCLDEHGGIRSKNDHRVDVIALMSSAVEPDLELMDTYRTLAVNGASAKELEEFNEPLGIVYGYHDLQRRKEFRPVEADPDTGEVDLSKAGIFQLMTSFVECPHTGEDVVLVPIHACSSCENPTPIMPHQVLTEITKDSGGFYTFATIVDEESGRMFWPDFTELVGVHGDDVSVQDILQGGIDALTAGQFPNYLNASEGGKYPELSPEAQAKLIGAEIANLRSKHGAERGGGKFARRGGSKKADAPKKSGRKAFG